MKKGLLFIFCYTLIANVSKSQTVFDWFDTAPDNNFRQGAFGARWTGGLFDEPGFGILQFNNNHQLNTNNNVGGTYNMHGLRFGSSNTNPRTIGGNAMRFFDNSGTDPKIRNLSTASHIISLNIEGDGNGDDPLEINPEQGDLTLSGTVNNQGSPISVYGSTSKTLTFSNIISGAGGLTIHNASNVVMTAQNSYSGLTTISAGSLRLNRTGGSTLPATNSITVAGGTLRISTDQTIANLDLSSGGNLTIDNGATLTVTGVYTPPASGGTIDNNGTLVINGSNVLSFPGASAVVSYMNHLTINNSSTVTLNNNLDIQGTLTLTNGTFAVAGFSLRLFGPTIAGTPGNLATTSSSSLTFSGTNAGPLTLPSSVVNLNNLTIENSNGTPARVDINSNLSIAGDLALNSGTLSIGANTLTLAGTASRTDGFLRGGSTSNLTCTGAGAKSLFFDNSTPATVDATTGTNSLANLTLSSSGVATLGNSLNLFGILDVPSGTTLNTGGFLVLRSNGTTTARVAANGAAGVSGTVDVERFTSSNKRAWRLITAPVFRSSTNTYQNNWQSSSLGTGTNIYAPQGAPNGFDGPTVSSSLLVWNFTTALWDNVANTTDVMLKTTNGGGSNVNFLFVRGDKTKGTGVGVTPNRAILGAKGNLFSGNQTVNIPAVASGTQKYICVSNPYASPINFETLSNAGTGGQGGNGGFGTGIDATVFYVWDPRVNTNGGWVGMTRSSATNYTSSINSAVSFASGEGNNGQFIQSGASFFLKPTTLDVPSTSIIFKEAQKATTVNATVTGLGNGLVDKFGVDLRLVNSDNTRTIMDGVVSRFNNGFSKDFVNNNNEDYLKLDQSAETISIMNGSTKTGIDGRPFITQSDTLQINMQRMVNGSNYEFVTFPTNFDATVTDARLIDKFLNTETPISLSANTTVAFNVTTATGSNASDRFMIVFRGTGSLPNRGFTVGAEKVGTSSVKVNWEAQAETGVKNYELQHSADGVNFKSINTQDGKNGNLTNTYSYVDNNAVKGINYYRVKTTQLNDIERYSNIITINNLSNALNDLNVFPNPVKGNTIGLQLLGLEKGDYTIRLFDNVGKEVYKKAINHNGNSSSQTITVKSKLAAGNYTLQLAGKITSYKQSVLVVE